MPNLGAPELILVIVIILLLFGAGRATEVFRALGSGIREFREAAGGSKKEEETDEDQPQA